MTSYENQELLKAKQSLVPRNFLRVSSNVTLDPECDPDSEDLKLYSMENCTDYERFTGQDGSFRVVYTVELGVAVANKDLSIDDDNFQFQARVNARYKVFYDSEVELSDASLDAFCEKHVIFHAWPFWREFVISSCQNAGMKRPLRVPLKIISEREKK